MDVIDQYVEQLDGNWDERPYDEQALREVLELIPPNLREADELRVELCAADMEWRWRLSHEVEIGPPSLRLSNTDRPTVSRATSDALRINKISCRSSADVSGLPMQPSASDYRPLLGTLWESELWRSQMLLAEWRTRSAFGDQPDIEDFAARFAGQTEWKQALVEVLEGMAWIKVTVAAGGNRVLAKRFPPEFIMGRQYRDEPPPPAWLPESQKLVIAASSNTSLSRRQIQVQRTQVRELLITNLSNKVPIQIDGGTLQPSESQKLVLPLRIGFGGMSVAIDAKMV